MSLFFVFCFRGCFFTYIMEHTHLLDQLVDSLLCLISSTHLHYDMTFIIRLVESPQFTSLPELSDLISMHGTDSPLHWGSCTPGTGNVAM